MVRRIVRLQREDRRARHTVLPEAAEVPPQSQWVHWVFPRNATVNLVRRCRREQASLGGAMIAAVCCGLMDCLPLPAALFKVQIPFDLRDELESAAGPITAQDLGAFVSIMNEYYDVRRESRFWDVARRAHANIHHFVAQGGPAFYYNLLTTVTERQIGKAVPAIIARTTKRVTLLATNYGVLGVRDAYGTLRPRSCTLMFKNDAVGPSLVAEALVMNDQLNFGLATDGLVPEFWQKLAAAVRRHLDAAAEPAATPHDPRQDQAAASPHRTSVAPHE